MVPEQRHILLVWLEIDHAITLQVGREKREGLLPRVSGLLSFFRDI